MSAKLEHINVFNKGMNTDTSDAIMPAEQYRYAENLRLITNEGSSSGELQLIEGEKLLRKIQEYSEGIKTGVIEKIKGITSVRNYIIIVGSGAHDGNFGDCVWYCTKNGDYISNPICVFGPSAEPFGDNVSLVTRYESENNVKLYIADGIHQLMSINIKHDGDNKRTIQDITNQVDSILTPLNATKTDTLNGTTNAPVVQYTYSVYRLGGQESGLAPLSKPVTFDDINTKDAQQCNGVELSVSQDFTGLFIKIYRIAYIQNGQTPNVYLICDEQCSQGFTFIDLGSYISQITLEDLNSISQVQFKPLLIESKADYLFASNIQYTQEEIDNQFVDSKGESLFTATFEFVEDDEVLIATFTDDTDGNVDIKKESVKSFRRGEWYRFGIVLYDNLGRKSSVLKIKDLQAPDIRQKDTFRLEQQEHVINVYAKPIKLRATIIPSTEDFRDSISGWEVVRCNRTIDDTINITQGISGRAQVLKFKNVKSSYPNDRFSFSYMTLQNYNNGLLPNNNSDPGYFQSCNDLLMFASPEQCYNQEELQSVLKNKKLNIQYSQSYRIPRYSDNVVSPVAQDFPGWQTDNKLYYGRMFDIGQGQVVCAHQMIYDIINQRHRYDTAFSILYPKTRFYSSQMANMFPKEIKNISFCESPDPFKVIENDTVNIDNIRTTIGDLSFVNFDALMFYKNYGTRGAFNQQYFGDLAGDDFNNHTCTTGKKCALLQLQNQISEEHIRQLIMSDQLLPITIVNIQFASVTPYGGIDKEAAQKLSVFYSNGEYFTDLTGDVKSGDTYLGMFVYNSSHMWYHSTYESAMDPTIYIVPVESSIDLSKTYGDLYPDLNEPQKYFQDVPVQNLNGYNQDNYAYMYNTAYSSNLTAVPIYPSKTEYIDTNRYDTRIHYSDPKTNGEYVDSWLKFKPMNFIDVDTRFGEITDMKLFRDTLVFWQKEATGILSVNERTIIKDANSSNILLGNSDVMQRYDYLTTQYGMVPYQKARTQSDKALYWWDGYKKEIIQYAGGNVVQPMKKEKTVSAYINGIQNLKEIPTLLYDDKYSEILINLTDQKSLVYNEFVQQFTSVYQVWFDHALNIEGSVLFTRDTKMYEWNKVEKNSEYIPRLDYVVNPSSQIVKVFDNMEIGMGEGFYYDQFYNGPQNGDRPDYKQPIKIIFNTPKQTTQSDIIITKREYDFKCAIPRAREEGKVYDSAYGNRMRGRVMNCSLESNSSNRDFSLQYIITKFRISYA